MPEPLDVIIQVTVNGRSLTPKLKQEKTLEKESQIGHIGMFQ